MVFMLEIWIITSFAFIKWAIKNFNLLVKL